MERTVRSVRSPRRALRGALVAFVSLLVSGCAGLTSPLRTGEPATAPAPSAPAAPVQPQEVRVSLAQEGLAGVLREHYMGAWVSVRPPGQFIKSLIRLDFPAADRKTFVCAVGTDYVGVCRPPPNDEMRTYPLAQVLVTFGEHCRRKGACAAPTR